MRGSFKDYITQRVTSETAERYLMYLDKYVKDKKINTPEDIANILKRVKNGRNWLAKSIRNLINFYVDVKGLDETVAIKLKRACKIEKSGVRTVFLKDEEIKDAYSKVLEKPEKVQVFFKLLVYSGVRAQHAYELLKTFDRNQLVVIPDKGIARYPLVEFSKGNKRGFFAYIPTELVEELKRFDKLSYRALIKEIRFGRVNANSIRKWHYNKLIESGVDTSIADFIQGRAPASVGAMHYLATARQADNHYAQAVVEIKKVLE